MHNVLIVDEEEHLLAALEQNLFPDRDDITILTATDGEQGLEHLKNSRVDLLISDIKMPGKIDGFQLILRAKEVAPDARVVIITAFGSNRVQNFADRIGITHYIEKPFNTSELRDVILEILDEKEGFQGVLSDLELTDIIQMLCLARRTALLHLKHRDHRGRIVFDNGEVVHAEFDDLVGEDAVYRMLAMRQGDIFMQGDFRNDQRTIEIGWQDLLFEGVRLADEERADMSEVADDDDAAQTDVGMPLSDDDVDAILADAEFEGEDEDEDAGPDESFFSADELREIELATEGAAEDSESSRLPFATLSESSDDLPVDGRIGVANGVREDDDFRSPFQRESSAMTSGLSRLSEISVQTSAAPDVEAHPTAHAEPEPDPATQVVELSPEDFPFEGLQTRLEKFARECPGLHATAIMSADEGLAINTVAVTRGVDLESFAALFADVVSCAQRTVDALGPDDLTELHVAAGPNYVLLRAIDGTQYHHLAVVDRHVSLGVALVLMRRLQRSLNSDSDDR